MADIIDINVFQSVNSISFEVEPITNIVNINKVTTTGYSGVPNLQDVTDEGATTTNPITANSFIKSGGTGANVLLDNGSTTPLTSFVGTTNLTYTSGISNGVVNSDTGTDATIPLADSTNAGLFSATEKTKLSGIASGAEVNVNADWNAVSGDAQILNKPTIPSITGLATTTYVDNKDNSQQLQLNYLDRDNSIFDAFYLRTIADGSTVEASNQLLSSLAVLRNISYVNQGYTQQINADKFVKLGGAADEYLMADGSISYGGGGGGGATNLTTTQTISNFTINSNTGTDATVPLGNGTLAGATLNDYTTAEKNKLVDTYTKGEVDTKITGVYKIKGSVANYAALPSSGQVIGDVWNLLDTGGNYVWTGTVWDELGTTVDISGKANIDSPTFTGIPLAPTAAAGTNNTQIATTAFTTTAIPWTKTGNDIENNNTGLVKIGGTVINGIGNQKLQVKGAIVCSDRILTNSSTGFVFGDGATGIGLSGNEVRFTSYLGGNGNAWSFNPFYLAATSGNLNILNFSNTINPISGTGVFNIFNMSPTINQTGGANGITRGIYINPTLASAADFRAIQVTAGKSIFQEVNATSFIKDGGTSSQILAADGSVITQGNNITITGGVISSVGGAGGKGSSVNYYLNGGTSQGAFEGSTYYEFSKTAVIGTGADFNISSNGYIASFITDVADPSLLLIPAGNWNLEFYFSSSSAGGSPSFYTELYKYDGTTFTSIASSSATPEGITNGTSIDAYFTPLAVPETVLTVNDRLAIRVFVNASSKTITLHTQNGHLCEVITTFTAGLTALNGLQAQVQNFATGTTGTDFSINSSGSTHTFNLPSASATARGVVTTGSQTFAGVKTFSSNPKIPINGGNSGLGALVIENGTGQLEVATNYVYPNLIEIQNVKGVTSAIQTQLDSKVDENTAITGATKTKITYDAKGLVTAGADIATTDISDFNSSSRAQTESELVAGTNITITPSGTGATRQLTIASTGGGGGTQGAYTVLANNTNSSASPTEQPFENLTNQIYTPTPVWTGTTAPSGTTEHTYSLSQIGNLVTLTINLSYGNQGSGLTLVTCELPSTAPTPALPSSVLVVGDIVNFGIGVLTTNKNLPTTNLPYCALRIKSLGTPNIYEIAATRGLATYRYAYITIQYFV
jgi:hypothetical protein